MATDFCAEMTSGGFAVDKFRDTASAVSEQTPRPSPPVPQKIEADGGASEIKVPSNLKERFANWGSD